MTCPPIGSGGRFGDPERRFRETLRYRTAARQARQRYPGPLGELVYRELVAYAELGYWIGDGVIPRLVEELLGAQPAAVAAPDRSPGVARTS